MRCEGRARIGIALLALAMGAREAHAQARPPIDSVFARAERLVRSGRAAAGRLVVDSVIASLVPSSRDYPTALYWRARLAPQDADRVPEYLRIVMQYPLSSRVGEAYLAVAEIERARGERALAAEHYRQFLTARPDDPQRAAVSLIAGPLLFEQNRVTEACAIILSAVALTSERSAELRNQLIYQGRRCDGVDTSGRADVLAPPPTTSTPPDSSAVSAPAAGRRPPAAGTAAAATARFTVQIAAYASRTEAERIATRLRGRGLEARVVGTKAPFRVHVGTFATRAEAETLSKKLTADKSAPGNFVTTIPPVGR
jgi:tetratricopeptide (TPR) repeat protein